MSEVMCQTNSFFEVFVGTQSPGNGSANLGNFQGVSQTSTVIISFCIQKDLGLIFQAAESSCVQDPISIPLERGSILGLRIRKIPPFTVLAADPIGSQAIIFLFLSLFSGYGHNTLAFLVLASKTSLMQ
jgi:hypothetical protein